MSSSQTRILVVDDSFVEAALVQGLLENEAFEVVVVNSADAALENLNQLEPDLIVTDLVMPGLSGLDLLVTASDRHPEVPVIVLTAHGNELIAADALRLGAASYVPKSQQAERLVEAVKRVLSLSFLNRARQKVIDRIREFHCEFELECDPSLTTGLVDLVEQVLAGAGFGNSIGRIRIGVALEEALSNAMMHGSLRLTSEEIGMLRRRSLSNVGSLAKRLKASRTSVIHVAVRIGATEAEFRVADEGPGFDVHATARSAANRFETGQYRGLTLMNAIMDEVRFNSRGNRVLLTKRIPILN